MAKYINVIGANIAPAQGKYKFIKANVPNSETIGFEPPSKFVEDLVCVVDNGYFEAAAYCDTQREFEAFADDDGRTKIWLIVPNVSTFAQ